MLVGPTIAGAGNASPVLISSGSRDCMVSMRDPSPIITACSSNSFSSGQNEEACGGDLHQSFDEIPKVARPMRPTRRLRKRAMAVEDREAGELTCEELVKLSY